MCLLYNTSYPTSTSEWLNEKIWLICTSLHQLDIRCYTNFKVKKFRLEKILYICLEQTNGVFGEGFLQSKFKYSANILRGVLQNCWKVFLKMVGDVLRKHWETISEKYCEVFCKITEIYFAKMLKGVPKTSWEVFYKATKKSAKILKNLNCFVLHHDLLFRRSKVESEVICKFLILIKI